MGFLRRGFVIALVCSLWASILFGIFLSACALGSGLRIRSGDRYALRHCWIRTVILLIIQTCALSALLWGVFSSPPDLIGEWKRLPPFTSGPAIAGALHWVGFGSRVACAGMLFTALGTAAIGSLLGLWLLASPRMLGRRIWAVTGSTMHAMERPKVRFTMLDCDDGATSYRIAERRHVMLSLKSVAIIRLAAGAPRSARIILWDPSQTFPYPDWSMAGIPDLMISAAEADSITLEYSRTAGLSWRREGEPPSAIPRLRWVRIRHELEYRAETNSFETVNLVVI